MFAQAMSSTSPTAPCSTQSAVRTLPITSSRSGASCTRCVESLGTCVPGAICPQVRIMLPRSASACARVAPGASRATR